MRGHPRAAGLEQRQQRPPCEEKMGPRPAREGTLELRPGDRAEAGVGELSPHTQEGLDSTLQGWGGTDSTPPPP